MWTKRRRSWDLLGVRRRARNLFPGPSASLRQVAAVLHAAVLLRGAQGPVQGPRYFEARESLELVLRAFVELCGTQLRLPRAWQSPPGPQVETVISSRAVLRVISEAISAFLKRYTNAAGNGAGVTLKGAIDMAWLCTGQQTVVLIDEYDYPLNHCRRGHEKMKGLYHDFFANIKAAAPHLKVLFVTGIMKFSSVGLFSGGNNVKNASFDEWSATCCGFTELEVRQMLELFPDTPRTSRWKS
eukprot:gene1079-biopygen869